MSDIEKILIKGAIDTYSQALLSGIALSRMAQKNNSIKSHEAAEGHAEMAVASYWEAARDGMFGHQAATAVRTILEK